MITPNFDTRTLLFALFALAIGADAAAQSGHRRPPRPPQEAIEACANKKADDACSFEGRDGTVEGRCFSPDDARPLACRPDRPPRSAPQ